MEIGVVRWVIGGWMMSVVDEWMSVGDDERRMSG